MLYKSYNVPISNVRKYIIDLGVQYEDGVRELLFDLNGLKRTYGPGSAILLHQPASAKYATVRDAMLDTDYVLHWVVKGIDTKNLSGTVVIQYRPFNGGEARSIEMTTTLEKSVVVNEDEPTEEDVGWYKSILDAYADIMAIREEVAQKADSMNSMMIGSVEEYFEQNPIIEDDPTVPDWAKQPTKPKYTAEEVGAMPDTYVAPVRSVNGETGDIVITLESIGAMPAGTVIPERYDDSEVVATIGAMSERVRAVEEYLNSIHIWDGGKF